MRNITELFSIRIQPLKLLKYFLIMVFTGGLLLILVFMLPSERIKEHIAIDSEQIIREGNYPCLGIINGAYRLDNYTDALLLMFNYLSDNSTPIYDAFVADVRYEDGKEGIYALAAVLQDDSWGEETSCHRGSNWLGMNIILRPLLYFFSFVQCRLLLHIVSCFALIVTICLITKRLGGYYAVGFGITMVAFGIYTLSLSFSLGIFCVLIACGVICYILMRKDIDINILHMMFVAGILTAYFDWLSIPLVTWGLPMLIFLADLYENNKNLGFNQYFNKVFQSGIGWCLGYAGMIISKCLIATLVEGSGALSFFVQRVKADMAKRTVDEFLELIRRLMACVFPLNLKATSGKWFLAIIALVFILYIIALIMSKKRMSFNLLTMCVGIMPFIYYIYLSGHVNHTHIEFRSMMITFFAVWILSKPLYDIILRRCRRDNKV